MALPSASPAMNCLPTLQGATAVPVAATALVAPIASLLPPLAVAMLFSLTVSPLVTTTLH